MPLMGFHFGLYDPCNFEIIKDSFHLLALCSALHILHCSNLLSAMFSASIMLLMLREL